MYAELPRGERCVHATIMSTLSFKASYLEKSTMDPFWPSPVMILYLTRSGGLVAAAERGGPGGESIIPAGVRAPEFESGLSVTMYLRSFIGGVAGSVALNMDM